MPWLTARHSSADHVPGVLGDERGAEDPVGALLEVEAEEALVLAVEDRAVDVVERDGQRVDRDAALAARRCSYIPTWAISGLV